MRPDSRKPLRSYPPTYALQVLLVESEPSRVMNLVRMLEEARPEWRVNIVRDRDAADRALSEASFDAILLDVGRARIDQVEPGALLAAVEERVLAAARSANDVRAA